MNQTNEQKTDFTPGTLASGTAPQETPRHSVFLADTRQIVNTTLRRAEEIRYAADIELAGRSRDNYFALERLDTSVPDMTRSAAGQAAKGVFGTGVNMALTLFREAKAGVQSAKLALEKSGETRAVTDAIRMGTMDPERGNRELAGIEARYDSLKSLGRKAMQIMRANHERFLQESGLAKDEKDGFVYDFFGGIATLGAAVAVTAVTKSPLAASALFGAYAGRQDYEEALQNGVTPGRAMLVGFAGGLAEGGLEHLGLGALEKVFKGKGILRAGLKGFTTEAAQEGSQMTAEEIIMQNFGGREKELADTFEDIVYSALLGGLTGAPVSVIMNAAGRQFKEKGANDKTAQKLAQIAVEHAGSDAVQQTAHNVLSNLTSALNYPNGDVSQGAKEFGAAVRGAQDRNVRRAVYNVSERTEQNARAAGYDPVTAELLGELEQSRANSIYALAGITPAAQMDLTQVRFERIESAQAEQAQLAEQEQEYDVETYGLPDDSLFQSAAMYRNKAESLAEFRNFAVQNQGNPKEDNKSFYRFTTKDGLDVEVPFERALHIDGEHHLTDEQFGIVEKYLADPIYAAILPHVGEYQGRQVKIKLNTPLGPMGAVLEVLPKGRVFLNTAFFDTNANIDNWAKGNPPNAPSDKPVFIGEGHKYSLADIVHKIKGQARYKDITEVHNQVTGEVIPLEMNPNIKPFERLELKSDFLPMAKNTADGKKQLIDSVFGKKKQIQIEKDGKIFIMSRSSVKKMQNTSITAAKNYAQEHNLPTEQRRQLYHDAGEQVAQALKVFETAQLILSHKDVKNVPGRIIYRYGNVFNYRGKTYFAMFVSKQDGALSDLHLYDLQMEGNKYTAGHSGVIDNPSQQRYINSIDELVRFVKRKIAKYNKFSVWPDTQQTFFQSAYHGTPHRFEEFSTEHIGTGEGAQAHGSVTFTYHPDGRGNRVTVKCGRTETLPGINKPAKKYKKQIDVTPQAAARMRETPAPVRIEKSTPGLVGIKQNQFARKMFGTLTKIDGRYYAGTKDTFYALVSGVDADKMFTTSKWFADDTFKDLNKEISLHLNEILPNAVLVKEHKDLGGRENFTIKRFIAPVAYNDDVYVVKLTVKEFAKKREEVSQTVYEQNGGKDYGQYNVEIVKKITLGPTGPLLNGEARSAQGSIQSIDKKGQEVKGYTLGELLEDVEDDSGTYIQTDKKNMLRGETYKQNIRGSVTFDENANVAVIRAFGAADRSTALHEFAHVWSRDLFRFENVSREEDFLQLLKDIRAWRAGSYAAVTQFIQKTGLLTAGQKNAVLAQIKARGGEEYVRRLAQTDELDARDFTARFVRRAFEEHFAESFENYVMRGKAPNVQYKSLFEKFGRWLRELYNQVLGRVEISPEVQSIFDRLLARAARRVDSNLFTGKVEQIKKLVQNIRQGKAEADGAPDLPAFKSLLEQLDAPAPKRPGTHLLKELRRRGAEYKNAGKIDKEAYKNARVYDKKGGVDDRPDVWLQKLGYMDFEETTPETLDEAYDKIQRALDGEEILPPGAEAQLAEWQNYKNNIDVLREVFGGNVKEIRATLKAILKLEEKGYRVVEKRDLTHLNLRLEELNRLADRLDGKSKTAQDKAAADKKTLDAARKIKRNILSELEKRQVEGKGELVKKLKAASSFEQIHQAAADALDFLQAAYAQTEEGRAQARKLDVPRTNWDGVRAELLAAYNDTLAQADETLKRAWRTLDELSASAVAGEILTEEQARAKEAAERTVRELSDKLDGQYVRAMEKVLGGIAHLNAADVRKFIASYGKKATRYRALNQSQVEHFIQTAKNVQEANYKKYMRGKIGEVLSRKTFEKVGAARRAKYTPGALDFLKAAAETWHGSQETALTGYEQAALKLDPNNPPAVWKALENRVLWAKADPAGEVSMADLRALYDDALAAVRGDRAFKRFEGMRQAVQEDNLRLAAELSLKDRKFAKGTAAYLLHGGTDLQTFLSICFGKYEVDEFDENSGVQTQEELPNNAATREEAVMYINSLLGEKLINKNKNLSAQINRVQRDKLVSEAAVHKSVSNGFTRAEHFRAVANIKTLFENAFWNNTRTDRNNDPNIRAIHEFYAPIANQAVAFILVKESVQNGARIYTLELKEIKKPQSIVGTSGKTSIPASVDTNSITKIGNSFKGEEKGSSHYTGNKSGSKEPIDSIEVKESKVKPQTKKRVIDFREELAPETNQIEEANFKVRAGADILRAIGEAYGLKNKMQILDKIAEMKKDTVELVNYAYVKDQENGEIVATLFKNGKPLTHNKPRKQTVSRLEALTFWIWNQDHDFVETAAGNEDYGLAGRLEYAYGKTQLENLFARLTPQDKAAAQNLQKLADKHHAEESLVHQRIYGFPLPKKEFYFPSVTDRTTDQIDMKQEFVQNSKAPSFIKRRVQSKRVIQRVENPVDILSRHLRRAGEFIYNAEKYTQLVRVFKQSSMAIAFEEAFGEKNGKKVYDKLLALINQQAPQSQQAKDEFYGIANKAFNGWVKAVMGFKPITGIKQFASSVSFAENMPWGDWAKWFAEGLANPLKTAEYMKRLSPYIQTRYETGGINESVLRAMAEDEISPIAARWNNLTNLMLLNTRLGDKASLIYGGYPYMKYLLEVKKLTPEEAAHQFEKQATRTLQSSLRVHLSEGQANADSFAARVFLVFKNQQLQYVRKVAESYAAYKNGEISAAQMAKTAFLYLILNPMVYTMLGIGWFAADEDDWGEDLKRLIASPVSQFFGAYPFGEGVADFFVDNAISVWKDQKLTVPQKAGLPMFDDIYKDVARLAKTVNADDIAVTDFVPVFFDAAKYTGLPTQTFRNMAGGTQDLLEGRALAGGLRLAGYTKNRAGKITGEKE